MTRTILQNLDVLARGARVHVGNFDAYLVENNVVLHRVSAATVKGMTVRRFLRPTGEQGMVGCAVYAISEVGQRALRKREAPGPDPDGPLEVLAFGGGPWTDGEPIRRYRKPRASRGGLLKGVLVATVDPDTGRELPPREVRAEEEVIDALWIVAYPGPALGATLARLTREWREVTAALIAAWDAATTLRYPAAREGLRSLVRHRGQDEFLDPEEAPVPVPGWEDREP